MPLVFVLSACGSEQVDLSNYVTKEEYDAVVAERDSYKTAYDTLYQAQAVINTENDVSNSGNDTSMSEETTEAATDNAVLEGSNATYFSEDNLEDYVSVQEHKFSVLGYNYFLLEITNNSDINISFESNALGKDASGNNVAAKSSSLGIIGAGETGIIDYVFSNSDTVETCEYTNTVKPTDFYCSSTSDVSYEVSENANKLIITVTNNNSNDSLMVKGAVLFLKNEECVYYSDTSFSNDSYKVLPNSSVSKEIDCYSKIDFDDYRLYITAYKYK
jgi:hypothetical protein